MEATPEGMAVAAATREAAKRKRAADGPPSQDGPNSTSHSAAAPAAKRAASRPPASCTHEVEVPPGYSGESDAKLKALDPELHGSLQQPVYRGKMAKKYPFTLDPFQQVSIACLVSEAPRRRRRRRTAKQARAAPSYWR